MAKAKGLTDLVGSIVPAALAATREYSKFAAGETIVAISALDDSAAGRSCGERCARLNHVMEELAVGLKQHASHLVEENKLLLAVMDGEYGIASLVVFLLPNSDRRVHPLEFLSRRCRQQKRIASWNTRPSCGLGSADRLAISSRVHHASRPRRYRRGGRPRVLVSAFP